MKYRSITEDIEYWCQTIGIELEHRSWQLFYTTQILWNDIQLIWLRVKIAFYIGLDEPGPFRADDDRAPR